ncbi:MAG: efflux RND transporter periplasmic adaptor subunit [Deltaproteobacteria bacterium]|nr:efflux RND transporter periplasmic adaptor subunit [Deltaproteobacteria bacterium]
MACSKKNEKKVPQAGDKVYPVSTLKVSLEELPEILQMNGTFVPSDKLDVKAEVEGKVLSVSVSEGQNVTANELLALMSPDALNLLLDKQQKELKELEAKHEGDEVNPSPVVRPNLPFLGFRMAPRPNGNPESQPTENVEGKPVNNDEVGEQAPPPSAEAPMPPPAPEKSDAQLKVEEAGMDRVRAEIALTEKKIEGARVLAGIPGIVVKKNIAEGSAVNLGEVLFQIVKTDPIQLSIFVPKESVGNLKLQDKAEVAVDEISLEGAQSGEIVFINPEPDPQNKSYEVRIAASNPELRIKSGMTGKATLTSSQKKKGILIPSDAVVSLNNKNYVYILKNPQVATRVEVTLGAKKDGRYEVKKGLKEADQVVMKGQTTFDEEDEFVKVENPL